MRCRRLFVVLFVWVLASEAFAWGMTGHEIINGVAVDGLQGSGSQYMRANRDHIQAFATVPDRAWRRTPTGAREAPLHFFHVDFYSEGVTASRMPMPHEQAGQTFSLSDLNHNGKGLWRVERMVHELVTALKEKRCKEAVQIAGTMGHYIADLGQPMHASSDYDGQSIGRRGIHAHFETKLVGKWDREKLVAAVRSAMQDVRDFDDLLPVKDLGGILPLIYREASVSLSQLPHVTAVYESAPPGDPGVDEVLKASLPSHMARGAFVLKHVWQAALAMSAPKGRSACANQRLEIAEPTWIVFSDEFIAPEP